VEALRSAGVDGGHEARLAAVRVEHVQLERVFVLGLPAAELEAGAARHRQPLPVGRPARVGEVARLPGQPHRRAARERSLVDGAARLVVPGHVRDPLAVGRHRGQVLAIRVRHARGHRRRVGRQPPRCALGGAAGERLDPDPPQRVEHHGAAVGRELRATQDAGGQRSLLDPLLPRHARRRVLHAPGHERDLAHVAAGERHPRQLAVVEEDDVLVVGRDRVAGEQVELGEALLLVAGRVRDQHALEAVVEMARDQHGLRVAPRDVDERLAVAGQRGPRAAADALGDRARLARAAVEPLHLPQAVLQVRDVVERAAAAGKVDEAAVGAGRRARGVVEGV
jgi:hypothetical protein